MKKTYFVIVAVVAVLALMSFSFPTTTYALEFPAVFKIKGIMTSSVGNYSFRIYSNGTGWLCQNGPSGTTAWAYVDESDSGSKGKIATLLTAYALGKNVYLVTQGVVVGSATYCHIIEFTISD